MPSVPEVYTPYLSARSATPGTNSSAIANSTDRADLIAEVSLASRASNAANGVLPLAVIPQNAVILSAWMVPLTSQAGSATNYADMSLINMGSDGTGTSAIASRTLSAAGQGVAANAEGSFAMSASGGSVSAGQQVGVSYTSQGNGIAIVAHNVNIAYRLQ